MGPRARPIPIFLALNRRRGLSAYVAGSLAEGIVIGKRSGKSSMSTCTLCAYGNISAVKVLSREQNYRTVMFVT